MKLTKSRLQKIVNNNGKQTRKKYIKTSRILKHTNTARHKKQFNLKNNTLKQY
jgi:YD repeat-containing protein